MTPTRHVSRITKTWRGMSNNTGHQPMTSASGAKEVMA